ncbi:MBL fold metallo-hydrolase [Thermoanaerobacterium sp. DL9XJH110]|uniref:MBL fold metallo-hydrolase n=1 Tax=Thermoanaerobacterium sp. DL9XJH110 TaxID=3386643 RepID=UPI003BB4F454
MKLTFCGGAGEVGASCYLLNIDGKNILLDGGIRMSSSKDALPDFRLIQENGGLDAILVSHAHTDHTGALPAISRQFPGAFIYMTHMTRDLTRVLLYDSLKIMEREAEIPIYAENHVREMLDRSLCFSPQHTFKPFNDSDIAVTFYSAGHIAGASAIYITGSEGSLFYSGDFSGFRQNSIEGASIPKLRPDVAIFESTYGDKLHANRQLEEERLVDSINEVFSRGGKVLIPAFALGRAQEVILILKKAINRGRLLKCPVYVDGMIRDICRIYKLNPNYLRADLAKKVFRGSEIFYDERVAPVESPDMRKEIVESKSPCVIIASSGMLTGGPSQWYAEKLAADERNFIAITGYQDEESPGRRLLNLADTPPSETGDRSIKLGDKEIAVKCGVGKYNLSAHADLSEILGLAGSLYPGRIFLVHGEPEVINGLGKEIQKDINTRVFAPVNGEQLEIQIKAPRKQKAAVDYPTMGKDADLDESNIRELWEFVIENIGTAAALSIEDLAEIWGKNQAPEHLRELLSVTPYFEPDRRRMFLYHAVEKSEIDKLKAPPVMEVNEMLKLVDEYFGPESGLYRKGARFEEKVALLYFNFPEIAKEKFAAKFREFEERTGWKVEVNRHINLAAVNEVIYNLLPPGIPVKKISYLSRSGRVAMFLEGEYEASGEIVRKFKEITGLDLTINEKGEEEKLPSTAANPANPMEQNEALRYIDEVFSALPHRPYKKSVKTAKNGVKYIELSFISKIVGERYLDKIKELEKITGYAITVSESCNQIEVINTVKRIAAEYGITLKKNPSIFLSDLSIQVISVEDIDPALKDIISERIYELTGFTLVWK